MRNEHLQSDLILVCGQFNCQETLNCSLSFGKNRNFKREKIGQVKETRIIRIGSYMHQVGTLVLSQLLKSYC